MGESEAVILILRLRPSRRKAREAAAAEALSLLRDLEPRSLAGGPLAEESGVFWIALPASGLEAAQARFPRLGYTEAVETITPPDTSLSVSGANGAENRRTRWRKQDWRVVTLYREEAEAFRAQAPDRRAFLLETGDGAVREIRGYRGDGGPSRRRALPVEDARLLVNLACVPGWPLLDPFAGAGGIAAAARAGGIPFLSGDSDLALRFGLPFLGARHSVLDARRLPFRAGAIGGIATEPPYDAEATEIVCASLREMARALRPGGRIALLGAARQAGALRETARERGLTGFLDSPVDRKGTECVVLAWEKRA